MDFKQIRTFLALSEHLHFGQAAERLGIAQPHVSRRLRQLEDDLGVRLFYRDRRNVRLTEAGEVFVEEARTLLKDAEVARTRARETALGRRGRLTVGLVDAAMVGVPPRILDEFHRRYPDVRLTFRELGSIAQLDALTQKATDVAFFHPPPRTGGNFEHAVLGRERLVAVLPAMHRLAHRKKLSLAELANEPWVMFPRNDGPPIYDRIIATCQKAGFSPRIVQEGGPVPTRLGLVAAGFGVHLVDAAWKNLPHSGVVYIPVEPTAVISLSCYWRKADPNPILKLFVAVVRRHEIAD